jgi:SAM-dependent methyltransferase
MNRDPGAHDAFLAHPIVHAYTAMRTLGNLHRHIESVIAEIRTRSDPGARVFALAWRGAEREIEVAAALPDRRFDVMGVSERAVEAARRMVEQRGLTNVEVTAGDPAALELEAGAYSVVTGQYSFHYVQELERFWGACHTAMHPGGVVLAQEYVGPSRLQWSATQIEAADRALAELVPAEHKTHHRTVGPDLAEEWLRAEPTLAARSDELRPTCEAAGFEIIVDMGAACGLLHPVLLGQIDTFDPASWEHNRILSALFKEEERLMAEGAFGHAFAMFIARRGA